jgi:preprotein translocase subunit SecD
MDRAREVVERRIRAFGSSRATVARQGRGRILVTLGNRADAAQAKELIGRAGRLEFRLVDTSATPEQLAAGRAPPGSEILYADGGVHGMAIESRRIVTASMIVDAQTEVDAAGRPCVVVRFDAAGSRRFARATRENVGGRLAIILDDAVVAAPVINEPILGGYAQISGGFTEETAKELAIALRSGPLPIDLVVIEERVLGK